MSDPRRSVIWDAAKGRSVVPDGGTLSLLVQAWDLPDVPVAVELYESDGVAGEDGSERVIGWIRGTFRKDVKKKQERLWLELADPDAPFAPAEQPPEGGAPLATFQVKLPTGPGKSRRVAVEVGAGQREGRLEVGVRVVEAEGELVLSPLDRDHRVVAFVIRDLDDPAVLDRFTPYVCQVASNDARASTVERYGIEFPGREWDDLPRTPLGFTPRGGDFDQLGCGHICLARVLAFWGEFDDPAAFIRRAELSESVPLTNKKGETTAYDPRPYRRRIRTGKAPKGEAANSEVHETARWDTQEIIGYPHHGVRAGLLWTWWWRQYKVFRDFPPVIELSGPFLKTRLAKFPLPHDDLEAPITYEVTSLGKSFAKVWAYLAGAVPPAPELWAGEQTPTAWRHPVPVILLLRDPDHWVVAVGYQQTSAGGRLIVHDSGNTLVKKKGFEGARPAGYEAFPRALHFLTKGEFDAHVRGLFAVRRLDPPSDVPSFG